MRAAAAGVMVSLLAPGAQAAHRPGTARTTPTKLTGVLRCAGGSTMRPLVQAWAKSFERLHPRVRIEVDRRVDLAAGGFQQLLARRVDLVDYVREPFPAEVADFERKFGYAPVLINVADGSFDTPHATDAIAIYVNAANPIRKLTLAQLRELFAAAPRRGGHEPPATWQALGLRGAWSTRPIHVYGMTPLRPTGNPPGIVNYLEHVFLPGRAFRPDLRVQRDRPGASALQAIVRAVAHDADGVGYSTFALAAPGVRAVPLAKRAGAPTYAGTPRQVADRNYPLSRRIYFGLNSPPGRALPPLAATFLEYVLSPAGQGQISEEPYHFLPLTPKQLAGSRRRLFRLAHPRSRAAYLTPSGAVTIVGYNDMREMLTSLDNLFARTHPGIHFALRLKGTRTAPAALASGDSLLAPMGAVFSPLELAAYRRVVGENPISFRIARDSLDARALSGPLAVIVAADNPVRQLTFAQLRHVFAAPRTVRRWGQLGLLGKWANRTVHAYGLASGTALGRFMRRHVLAGQPFARTFRGLRESASVVRQVGVDPLGIGFAAMNRADAAVRVVPLARRRGEPPSRGTRAAILAGRYPLERYLRIYLRIPPGGHLDPLARQYMALALSPRGQRAIAAGHLGYLPLSARAAAAERARLRALP